MLAHYFRCHCSKRYYFAHTYKHMYVWKVCCIYTYTHTHICGNGFSSFFMRSLTALAAWLPGSFNALLLPHMLNNLCSNMCVYMLLSLEKCCCYCCYVNIIVVVVAVAIGAAALPFAFHISLIDIVYLNVVNSCCCRCLLLTDCWCAMLLRMSML